MKIFLLAAVTAFFCLAGCNDYKPVSSAAENGLRKDLKAVGEVLNFREISTDRKEAPGGGSAL